MIINISPSEDLKNLICWHLILSNPINRGLFILLLFMEMSLRCVYVKFSVFISTIEFSVCRSFSVIVLCFQSDPRKAENFDKQFKRLPLEETPPDPTSKYILSNLKGNEFEGFSFANPEFGASELLQFVLDAGRKQTASNFFTFRSLLRMIRIIIGMRQTF